MSGCCVAKEKALSKSSVWFVLSMNSYTNENIVMNTFFSPTHCRFNSDILFDTGFLLRIRSRFIESVPLMRLFCIIDQGSPTLVPGPVPVIGSFGTGPHKKIFMVSDFIVKNTCFRPCLTTTLDYGMAFHAQASP